MISLEKWMILTTLQKLTKNVGDLGKIIVAKCFEWLPKAQKIAQSGHTGSLHDLWSLYLLLSSVITSPLSSMSTFDIY